MEGGRRPVSGTIVALGEPAEEQCMPVPAAVVVAIQCVWPSEGGATDSAADAEACSGGGCQEPEALRAVSGTLPIQCWRAVALLALGAVTAKPPLGGNCIC